jgi:cytochrome P450
LTSTTTDSLLLYDPFADLALEDPYPLYARLRDDAPLYHNPDRDFWALTRFADVQEAARDWETFSSMPCADPDYVGVRLGLNSFLDLDPPTHDILRRIVRTHFTPKAVAAFEASTTAIAQDTLKPVLAAGRADLAKDVAWPFPLHVTMALLGLPQSDFDFLRTTFERLWVDNRLWIEPGPEAPSRAASAEIHRYFESHITDGAASGGVMDTIVEAHNAGAASLHELTEVAIVLYIAGYETTANLLSNSFLHLAEHPGQRSWLSENLTRLPDAVEELLRFDAPVQVLARTTTRAVRLHGQAIPTGARVLLVWGAANRDPRRYADPDRLDLSRLTLRHVAFGNGIHHCLGAPLARQEARVMLTTLLTQIPEYEIAGPVRRNVNMVSTRGIDSLPVELRTGSSKTAL